MKSKKLFYSLLVNFLFLLSIFSQENLRPIIVNPSIGDTLDLYERNYYGLFPQVKNFEWAVFYKTSNEVYKMRLCTNTNGLLRDTLINNINVALINSIIMQKDMEEEQRTNESHQSLIFYFKDGRKDSGELLSVREQTLLVDIIDKDKSMNKQDHLINVFPKKDITRITIEGKSHFIASMVSGLMIGGGLGILIGFASGDDEPNSLFFRYTAVEKAGMLGVVGGVIGWLIGTIVGITTIENDNTIEVDKDFDFTLLKKYTKYPIEEPPFLRMIKNE